MSHIYMFSWFIRYRWAYLSLSPLSLSFGFIFIEAVTYTKKKRPLDFTIRIPSFCLMSLVWIYLYAICVVTDLIQIVLLLLLLLLLLFESFSFFNYLWIIYLCILRRTSSSCPMNDHMSPPSLLSFFLDILFTYVTRSSWIHISKQFFSYKKSMFVAHHYNVWWYDAKRNLNLLCLSTIYIWNKNKVSSGNAPSKTINDDLSMLVFLFHCVATDSTGLL